MKDNLLDLIFRALRKGNIDRAKAERLAESVTGEACEIVMGRGFGVLIQTRKPLEVFRPQPRGEL